MKAFVCLMLVSLALVSAQEPTKPLLPPGVDSAHWDHLKPAIHYTEILQRFVDGLATIAGKPTADISLCFSPSTGVQTVQLIENILTDVSEKNLANIPLIVSVYKSQVSEFLECLNENPEFVQILEGLSVKNVSLDQIFLKFSEYALTGNYEKLVAKAKEIHETFGAGKFEEAGEMSGELLKGVLNYKPNSFGSLLNLNAIAKSASFLERVLRERRTGNFKFF